jgi:hypothetical protein
MERVWELENETFQDTAGFVFAPITQVVDPDEDPTALHPEIQRHLADIRTDLDRFSNLEISSLVRHGYCVGRKVCREHLDLFGAELPGNSPWDPIRKASEATSIAPLATPRNEASGDTSEATAERRRVRVSRARRTWRILPDRWARYLAMQGTEPSPTTVEARILQASAGRRIWSTLLDYRDWISYIYVPLLVPIFTLLPYFVKQYYEWTHRTNLLVQSLSQGSPALEMMSRLLRDGPNQPWVGVPPEPAGKLDELDLRGFEILQVSHTMDLRRWKPDVNVENDSPARVHIYRTLKVRKEVDNPGNDIFRYRFFAGDPKAAFRFPRQELQPKLRKVCDGEEPVQGKNDCRWEVSCDFTRVPAGEWRDIIVESQTPATFLERRMDSAHMTVEFPSAISEVTFWILLPRERQYRGWRIVRHTKETGASEALQPATEFLADNREILAFKLMAVKPTYRYEIIWNYK